MQYIKDLREGEKVSGVYLCKTKNMLKTKMGKSYYALVLQDKTGVIDTKVWELTNGIENFEAMDFIYINGQVTTFQGSYQLNVNRIRKAGEGEYLPEDYVPTSTRNIDEMYQELVRYVASIKEPHLSQLVESFFIKDKEFVKRFKSHSAAKSIHHGFVGGLLEHTLGVVKMSDFMASAYPVINRDLLITAALFHDVGKLEEISVFPENDYTDDGQLLGHIVMGAEMVGFRIREIPGFPKKLASELRHCILAHHGELEYGSPKKPALVEAVALNFADDIDAKMETMTEIFRENADNNGWLGFNRLFESNLRKTSK